MAEVQLFGDYLNLHGHSTVARREKAGEGPRRGRGPHGRELKRKGGTEGEGDRRTVEVGTTAEVRKDKTAGKSKVHLNV